MTPKAVSSSIKEKLSFLFIVLAIVYFVALSGQAYFQIRHEKALIQENYELLFSSKNSHSMVVAGQLSDAMGVKASPSFDDSELIQLAIKTDTGKYVVATGQAGIARMLPVFFDDQYPPVLRMSGGLLFALVLAAVALMPVSYLSWLRIAFLIGAVAAAAIFSGCASCGTTGADPLSKFASYLPLAGGVWFATCCILSFFEVWNARWFVALTYLVCGLAISLQGFLMLMEPKACFFCAMVAGTNVFFIRARASQATVSSLMQIPYLKFSSVAVVCCLIVAPKVSLTFGFVRPPTGPMVNMKEIVGDKASDHLIGTRSSNSIILVSAPGCEACELARTDLDHQNVKYEEILPCNYRDDSHELCYDSKGSGTVTPILLIVDKDGRISYANAGWPSSTEQVKELIQYVKQTAGKNLTKGGKNEE